MKKKFQNSKTETIVYFICSLAGLLLCLAACGFLYQSAEGNAVSLCGTWLCRRVSDTEDWWQDPSTAYSS